MTDIKNASGEVERFEQQKLCNSLKQAGAPLDLVNKVCRQVEHEVVEGSTTEEIFEKAYHYLAKENLAAAARYRLRRALMDLGPAGFLFEQYVEAILRQYGYKTKRDRIIKGHCVSHEIDILANSDAMHYFIEVKYHNERGLKTDVKTVMYMYARLLDIAKAEESHEVEKVSHKAWLVTNTKFTVNAVQYAMCMGIKLTGWNYPAGESLEDLIVKKSLYPVTVLKSMDKASREQFSKNNLMFAKDILRYSGNELVSRFGVAPKAANRIMQEVEALIHPG